MASKFNAKNMHYEKQEPAFLRRFRSEAAGGGDMDRHSVQTARPGKKPRLEMDEDDGPTIVYESEGGGNVGREEYEALTKSKVDVDDGEMVGHQGEGKISKDGGEGKGEGGVGEDTKNGKSLAMSGAGAAGDEPEREKQKVADVGGMKKRKAGKIVGGEDNEVETTVGPVARPTTSSKSKPSKAQKKVKLSFDEPDN